ncbi:hypothetical protein K402DRAFT_466899 [Aulographum hederae CBS 113979]|uniref:CFEM domain-containing protein n=1 Tax=Aulographum hederae CBS 113979 TaxID=1176131 RepID=A0A6G1GMX8_9PEZI|nr:hypothetical protein K402DRAFT_466899 [Aulographum hederae CBS 113979]
MILATALLRAVVAACLTSLATAVSIADLPACAQAEILQSLLTSPCIPSDTLCICADKTLLTNIGFSISKSCPSSAQSSASAIASSICAASNAPGSNNTSPITASTSLNYTSSSSSSSSSTSTTYADITQIDTSDVVITGALVTDAKPFTSSVMPDTTTAFTFVGTSVLGSEGTVAAGGAGKVRAMVPMLVGKEQGHGVGFWRCVWVGAAMGVMGVVFAEL